MATIAEQYYKDTQETVVEACRNMYEYGFSITKAARVIGYGTSNDLRLYLQRRGVACPWPKSQAPDRPRGRPPIKVTDEQMESYVAMRKQGVPATVAAAKVGHAVDTMSRAIRMRRKDLSLPKRGRIPTLNDRGK